MLIEVNLDPLVERCRIIRGSSTGCFTTMAAMFDNVYKSIWENPEGKSAQEVFDALGNEDAVKLVMTADVMVVALQALGQINNLVVTAKTKPDNVSVDIDETGRVIVTQNS